MKKISALVLSVLMFALLAGCSFGVNVNQNNEKPDTNEMQFNIPGANPEMGKSSVSGIVAGIGQGLLHGAIAPVTLIVSFFNEEVQMYEVHNNGKEYNLGFLLGVAIIFILLGVFGSRRV